MRRLLVGGLVATVIATVSTTTATASGDSAATETTTSGAAVSAAQVTTRVDVRKRFGLNSDPTFVASVKSGDSSELGIPLTPAEVVQFKDRDRAGEQIQAIDQHFSQSAPDSYAGTWIDQASGGVLTINTTEPSTIELSWVTPLIPSDVAVRVKQVTQSSKQLAALFARIDADSKTLPQLAGAGYGTLVEDNVVVVNLGSGEDAAAAEVLYERYGHAGLLIHTNAGGKLLANRYDPYGPPYGGKEVNQGPYNACTGGTSAVSGFGYFVIMAGHCSPDKTTHWHLGDTTQGAGLDIGHTYNNGFFDYTTTYCDCTASGPISQSDSTNSVIVNNGSLYTYSNYASQSGNYYSGRPACTSGMQSNVVMCDKIRMVNYKPGALPSFGHTTTLAAQYLIYCDNVGGDSGAPVGNGPTLLGMVSGGYQFNPNDGQCGIANQYTWFSAVAYLNYYTGATPTLPAQ